MIMMIIQITYSGPQGPGALPAAGERLELPAGALHHLDEGSETDISLLYLLFHIILYHIILCHANLYNTIIFNFCILYYIWGDRVLFTTSTKEFSLCSEQPTQNWSGQGESDP